MVSLSSYAAPFTNRQNLLLKLYEARARARVMDNNYMGVAGL